FSMTAIFIASFTEQWITHKNHLPAIIGVLSTIICLFIFGKNNFLIPSMLLITIILTFLKNNMEVKNA
ncbi:MAG: branched-chain amino acid ABC transporter permease, partial [Lachnospiraceae bacterium]|nr:branched-chain amino acid ABC transporter permease [Lachnospiraceae bacterium]